MIDKTKALLKNEKQLDDLTVRQLRKLLLAAAENPGTIPEVVARRVELETKQSAILDGYTFCLQPKGASCAKPITANDIDDVLKKSRDLNERQRFWTVSKEIGRPLKPGLIELVKLRNQVARELGYHSFFALKVADYGMTVDEMMKLLDDTLATTKPLYDGLHCWAKNQLAARYKRPVPEADPRPLDRQPLGAELAGDRRGRQPRSRCSRGRRPRTSSRARRASTCRSDSRSCRRRSGSAPTSTRCRPAWRARRTATRRPGTSTTARDVRSLMSVQANEQWFATSHHELGHIYYFLAYSRPEVPYLLREGANRAFHEAIGELAKLASQQTPYLTKIGVIPEGKAPDPGGWLLQSALDSIVFLPWSAGTMSHFERDLYENELPPTEWQGKWWDYVAEWQGVTPPGGRDPELCDACTKTHINDDAAEYYDYALATLIKFQLHDHICTKILKQDVRACDYSGSKEVGAFLKGILSLGATRDWRKVIKDATGEPISPRALMAFYAPLLPDLAKRNEGKDCTR